MSNLDGLEDEVVSIGSFLINKHLKTIDLVEERKSQGESIEQAV
jgi:hypothetical protein